MKVKTKVPVFFFFFWISLSWYVVGFSPVFSRMHLSLYTPPMASSIPNLRRLFAQEKVEIEHFYSTLEMSSYQNRDFFALRSQEITVFENQKRRLLSNDSYLLSAVFRFWQLFINILSAIYCHQSAVCLHLVSCRFRFDFEVDFWRKMCINVARFARNVVKWDFLGVIFNHCE